MTHNSDSVVEFEQGLDVPKVLVQLPPPIRYKKSEDGKSPFRFRVSEIDVVQKRDVLIAHRQMTGLLMDEECNRRSTKAEINAAAWEIACRFQADKI